jgi:hypothetical protein
MKPLFGDFSTEKPTTFATSEPTPVGIWKIAFGVLLGQIMTGILGGIAYALVTAK